MTSCCVCFDLKAAIALLSCNNCRLCSSCYQDLFTEFTNATGISTLKCQCPNQSTIIINTNASTNLTNPPSQVGQDSHDLAQTYRQSLTKTLKGLTNLTRKLQIFMSLRQEDVKLAPNRIRAMLKVQVSYLPTNLIHQRAEELAKELAWYNHSQIKAIQLEITAVSEWITVHNNLLAGVNVNTSQAYHHYTQNLRPLVVTAIKKAEAVQHIEKYGVVVYQELSPIDLNKVGAVVQLFNNNTGTGYIIETKRQCGQYLNIRAYHDDDKVGRWQIISKAGFRDQFYNNDKLITKVTVADCRLSKYGVQTCSLRQYWPQRRFYCSILPPAGVRSDNSEAAPCLRSCNIKNGSLDGWCYLMPGTVNDLVIVQDEAVGTLRGKVSGLYNEGVLVEAMD